VIVQSTNRKLSFRGVAIVVVAALLCGGSALAQNKLTISAAASLKESLEEAETVYRQSHGDVNFANNYGASGMLAAQIDQGAPVDVFFSAAAKQMDDLQNKGLIGVETRRNLLRNTLVLIVPIGSQLKDFHGLTLGSVRVIAVGDPASVPAGQYAKQTFTALHLQDQLQPKLVFAKDVRQVLTYVETGNADAGLVYGSDALTSNKVRVVTTAPDSSHDPIIYPAAVLKKSHSQDAARKFVEFLATPAAQAIFQKHGFATSAQ